MTSPQIAPPSVLDQAPFGRFQMSIVLLCALVAMLDGFDTQSIAYVAPRMTEEWGLHAAAFGPIFGAGLLGLAVGAFVFSPLADRFGRKGVLLLCVAIFGVFALLTARVTGLNDLLLLRFLTGLGLGGAMPNIIAITSEYAPSRIKATLVTVMFCGFPLGSTLGGLAAAPLMASHGWQGVFVAGGVMPLVLLPVLALFIPESARFLAMRPGREARLTAILRRVDPTTLTDSFIAGVRAETSEKPRAFPVLDLFAEGRARQTLLVWLAFFMNLLVMYFLVNWLPSLLKDQGQPLKIAILSTALLNLGGVVGGIVLGRLIDRGDPYLVLGATYLASALFVGGIALAGSHVVLLLAAATACGFGVSGAQIGLNAVTAAAYPTAMRSTGIGWALGVGRVGSILGPVIGGMMLGMGWSPQALLRFAVIPALISAGAVLALRRR